MSTDPCDRIRPHEANPFFGNAESMVRWIREDQGGWTRDFSGFGRYLDLALKYTKPDVVCLYWDLYCGRLEWGRDRVAGATGPKVSLLDERAWLIRSGCLGSWTWYEEQAPTVLAEKLFSCAATVATKLEAKQVRMEETIRLVQNGGGERSYDRLSLEQSP